jgi:hypothetical protein
VKDVDRDHVLVAYDGGWQRDAWLSVSSIRPALAPYNAAEFNPIPGEVVEVKAKSAEHEPYSWWRGSLKTVRPNPALAALPDSLGSTANQLIYEISYAGWESEFTETLEKEMLRPFNKQVCFSPGEIGKHTLPLAPQMAQLLTAEILQPIHFNANTLALYIEPAGTIPSNPSPSAAFSAAPQPTDRPHIHVIGSDNACQRAVILLANQVKLLNEQMQLSQNQYQQQQQQQQQQSYGGGYGQERDRGGFGNGSYHRGGQNGYGRSNSPSFGGGGGNQYDMGYTSATAPYTLEFHCPAHLMGMVIGKRHKNLGNAEKIEGILKIHVDSETGSIVVLSRTPEAAAGARSLLELTEQLLQIPSVIVGRVVGKNFSIIKEIEQHSGVLRIKVGDDRDHDLEFLQNLALNGIPGVTSTDENGNPVASPSDEKKTSTGPVPGEKEKRSAFDVTSGYGREDRRGGMGGGRGGRGYWERDGGYGRGGRYQDDAAAAPPSEEFDIVALEDDKTVEISIIGSPATVSEAELLLRTHIGLITQIYKLSFDEAMLKREVEALSLMVPMKGGPGGPQSMMGGGGYAGGYGGERGGYGGYQGGDRYGGGGGGANWEDRDRGYGGGGGHGHGHQGGNRGYERRGRPVKDDGPLPAWMNDDVTGPGRSAPRGFEGERTSTSQPMSGPASGGRRKEDPSANIHAARLQGGGAGAASAAGHEDNSRGGGAGGQRRNQGRGGGNRRGGRGGRQGEDGGHAGEAQA